jgi:hypothetical protein
MSLPRQKRLVASRDAPVCYLKPTELFSHETESLQKMAMAAWPAPLSWWKRELLDASRRAKSQGALHIHVWFEAHDPRAAVDAPKHIIELGAEVVPAGAGLVSYFFAIGQMEGEHRRGLRKLNFDLGSIVEREEPKPEMHTQISGRMPPCLAARYGADAFDHLFPRMDKPRIVCLPKSFALLTHLALLEYQSTDDGIRNFVSDQTWLRVVRSAEEQILRPHFEFCIDWMGQTAFRSRSLLSRFYGLPT